ncbi:MAG: GNAT family N-acetyltransferase [Sedimentisphaerales bacterium]|nr:GNAT family N-acetyltransferase [Sedimentisphaerales bacterium]
MSIRTAGVGDISAIQGLYRQLDGYHAELFPDIFQAVEGDARGDDFIRQEIESERADYLLAELDGRVVGFISMRQLPAPPYPMYRLREFASIDNAVVDEGHRGEGIGTTLFAAGKAWARERGLRTMEVGVCYDNEHAREFYLHVGFRPGLVKMVQEIME